MWRHYSGEVESVNGSLWQIFSQDTTPKILSESAKLYKRCDKNTVADLLLGHHIGIPTKHKFYHAAYKRLQGHLTISDSVTVQTDISKVLQ